MLEGTVIRNKYRIQCELGRGAFAAVYRAEELQSGRPVAIKVLTHQARGDKTLRHRLQRESKLAGQLQSPHAVNIVDYGTLQDGAAFLVMELLDGIPLDNVIRAEGPLPVERARHIMRQVLDPVGEAHALGVLHRDLKPANIFLCRRGEQTDFVKVIDFGVAKIIGKGEGGGPVETTRLTRSGEVIGTPVYMSPEQCRNRGLCPGSDLYSLGIVLYEMLAGRVPFQDVNPVQIILMHRSHPVPPLPEPLESSELAAAMRTALAKDPGDRFQRAEEFLLALNEQVQDDILTRARRRMAQPLPVSWSEEEAEPAKRTVPYLWVGLTVAGLLLLALVVGWAVL